MDSDDAWLWVEKYINRGMAAGSRIQRHLPARLTLCSYSRLREDVHDAPQGHSNPSVINPNPAMINSNPQ